MASLINENTPPPGRPDTKTIERMLALGKCKDSGGDLAKHLQAMKEYPYVHAIHMHTPFLWIRNLSWENAVALLKAVVRLEEAKISQGGGSVSAIIGVYKILEEWDPVQAMEAAAWVVKKSRNPWAPFGWRKTRALFEKVLKTSSNNEEAWQQLKEAMACENERQVLAAQKRQSEDEEAAKRRTMLDEIARRLHEERLTVQHARSEARKKLVQELEKVSLTQRLEHIAWDDTRPLSFYPDEFAQGTLQEIMNLDPHTRERLFIKLRELRSGPWRRFLIQLQKQQWEPSGNP